MRRTHSVISAFGVRSSFGLRTSDFGFTLIEIMIVVAILGIVLAMGIPAIYGAVNKDPMQQTISDVMRACSMARSMAILGGRPTQLVFHPQERSFQVEGGAGKHGGPPSLPSDHRKSGSSWTLDDRVGVDALEINLMDFSAEPNAAVTFHPDGTCDEFLMILHADKVGQRGITLECTTGLASVLNQDDLQRLRQRL